MGISYHIGVHTKIKTGTYVNIFLSFKYQNQINYIFKFWKPDLESHKL